MSDDKFIQKIYPPDLPNRSKNNH